MKRSNKENRLYKRHCFNIGFFECWVIYDGYIVLADGSQTNVMCLFIQTGDNNILIDTGYGLGQEWSEPEAGKLLNNLGEIGIYKENIDTVIISHGHIDHIGGVITITGKPMFPNARYVMLRKEWEVWKERIDKAPHDKTFQELMLVARGEGSKEHEREQNIREASQAIFTEVTKNALLPIIDKVDLIDNTEEIVHGINFVIAPGHTPFNAVIKVRSNELELICTGDMIHNPAELLNPEMLSYYDENPEEAINSRNKIIGYAAENNTLVFASHFPFPGLGQFKKDNGVFSWEPKK